MSVVGFLLGLSGIFLVSLTITNFIVIRQQEQIKDLQSCVEILAEEVYELKHSRKLP